MNDQICIGNIRAHIKDLRKTYPFDRGKFIDLHYLSSPEGEYSRAYLDRTMAEMGYWVDIEVGDDYEVMFINYLPTEDHLEYVFGDAEEGLKACTKPGILFDDVARFCNWVGDYTTYSIKRESHRKTVNGENNFMHKSEVPPAYSILAQARTDIKTLFQRKPAIEKKAINHRNVILLQNYINNYLQQFNREMVIQKHLTGNTSYYYHFDTPILMDSYLDAMDSISIPPEREVELMEFISGVMSDGNLGYPQALGDCVGVVTDPYDNLSSLHIRDCGPITKEPIPMPWEEDD